MLGSFFYPNNDNLVHDPFQYVDRLGLAISQFGPVFWSLIPPINLLPPLPSLKPRKGKPPDTTHPHRGHDSFVWTINYRGFLPVSRQGIEAVPL